MSEERIQELERTVADLRARLVALAAVLPVEYLPWLELDAEGIALAAAAVRMWDDWDEAPRASDVTTELRLLWRRVSPIG
jgi:hypothetical protein